MLFNEFLCTLSLSAYFYNELDNFKIIIMFCSNFNGLQNCTKTDMYNGLVCFCALCVCECVWRKKWPESEREREREIEGGKETDFSSVLSEEKSQSLCAENWCEDTVIIRMHTTPMIRCTMYMYMYNWWKKKLGQ